MGGEWTLDPKALSSQGAGWRQGAAAPWVIALGYQCCMVLGYGSSFLLVTACGGVEQPVHCHTAHPKGPALEYLRCLGDSGAEPTGVGAPIPPAHPLLGDSRKVSLCES